MAKDITSFRGTVDFLKAENQLLTVDAEVDPILEVAGIAKQLDNTLAVQFNNVKGYPGQKIVTGVFSRADRVAKIFDVQDGRKLKFRGLEAIKNPLPPKVVDNAPCQEVVVDKDVDVYTMPILRHAAGDAGRIIAGGIVLISGKDIGHCTTYKRIHFRGKDWSSMAFNPGSHFEHFVLERRAKKQNLPLTINISTNPAVGAVAGGGGVPLSVPFGADELGIAGRIQGAPVGIVKAKTQDAWSIADSEWVIEGYIDTNQVIWENNEAEAETAKDPKAAAKYFPFFVESNGHVGRARQTYKFVATAVTRRKDGPIYHAPLAHSFEYPAMMTFTNDAALFDVLNRQWPGLVADVNSLPCMMGPLGTVIQVRKRRGRDEDHIRDLIMQTMVTCTSLRMVVVVDEEVDIYDANEVMWAMITRADAGESVMIVPPGGSWSISRNRPISPSTPKYRIGFDCTVPVEAKAGFNRGEFPKVDLAKWFSAADIARMKAMQAEYARVLAEKRV